jgi:hypothetical protein
VDHFLNHFGKEIDEYVKQFGDKFFMLAMPWYQVYYHAEKGAMHE